MFNENGNKSNIGQTLENKNELLEQRKLINMEMERKAADFLSKNLELDILSNQYNSDFIAKMSEIIAENPPEESEIIGRSYTDEYAKKINKLTIERLKEEELNKLKAKEKEEKRKKNKEDLKNKINNLLAFLKIPFKE